MKHFFKKRFDKWVKNRSTPTRELKLTQKRIYIFLSREGLLYGALLMITFIAGVNYANNLVLGLCFYLGSVLVICIHYTYAQLSGLHIKLLEVNHAQAGGQVLVRLQLSASGSKPHHQIQLSFDADLNNPTKVSKICPRILEPHTVEFYLPAKKRGKFYLPRLTISSGYPLGILRTWSYMYFSSVQPSLYKDKENSLAEPVKQSDMPEMGINALAWIWPKPLAFTQYGQDFIAESSMEAINQYKKGIDDFDRLDNYVTGESMARVSWRHVASGRGMLTKHFADPVGQDVLLDYANMPASTHEAKLSQLSFAVQQLSQSMTPFMLKLPHASLPLNTGSEHEKRALLLLAKAPV